MKRVLLFVLNLFILISVGYAAYLRDVPVTVVQPNGDTLHCFATGDEFYNYLHDAEGYTIIQHPQTGYYVYAIQQGDSLVASSHVAGVANPRLLGLTPHLRISRADYEARRARWQIPQEYALPATKSGNTNRGTLNNLVIYIRFSDQSSFSSLTAPQVNSMFNGTTGVSLNRYFKAASYNMLTINTHFYPAPSGQVINSYQDSHPRGYYCPYNASTNTIGYQTDDERRNREFTLLQNAVNSVASSIPTSLNIDYNNDGRVDNICFIVEGESGGWNDLLWPHKWAIYDRNVTLNGKRVYEFNLCLAASLETSTLCHEMFHTLGAPDLYHYYEGTSLHPVGSWDLMQHNATPPQHMGAYMKFRYGNWIDNIPEITQSGTYTLNSIGDATNSNNCYKIASTDPNQFYVIEYRDNTEEFETALRGRGLLIYRIDTRFEGNANYDGTTVFDEVYIFRPNGTATTNGNINNAHFSSSVNRTVFNASTNPYPFFTNGTIDGSFEIYDISAPGTTITFKYRTLSCQVPTQLAATSVSSNAATFTWQGSATQYEVEYGLQGFTHGTGTRVLTSGTTYTLSGLSEDNLYDVYVRAICGANDTSSYSQPLSIYTPCAVLNLPFSEQFASQTIPSCWSQTCLSGEYNWVFGQVEGNYTYASCSSYDYESNITRLEMPFLNLEGILVPKLTFSHKQAEWDGDQDELWIYYRTSSTGSWQLLAAYTDDVSAWTARELLLPSPSASYQIAFEAHVNYGHGVMLRDVQVTAVGGSQTYTLTVSSSDPTMGSVSGGGSYMEGAVATLTATANSGYRFVQWSDGNLDNPRSIIVNSNMQLVAQFADLGRCTLSYQNSTPLTWLGTGELDEFYWGIRFPAGTLNDYDQITKVRFPARDSVPYQIHIFEGQDSVPTTLLATYNVRPTQTPRWYTYTLETPLSIDHTKHVWVILSTSFLPYPVLTCNYCGNPDASWFSIDGSTWWLDTRYTFMMQVGLSRSSSLTVSACDSYTWNGHTYTQSGDYTWTGQAANGCDSIVTLHLTINQSITHDVTESACDSYTWNGQTYMQSGDYTWAGQAANGCDSIVTLHLTIHQSIMREITVSACDSYTWHGQTYTQSGEYTWTGQAANGCDSVVTLHLTINHSVTTEQTVVACRSYTWHGQTYTQSGNYTWTGSTINGCDSTVTLHLTISNLLTTELTVAACGSYTWHGQTYTQSGDYTWTGQSANGCDSVVTLHLTINQATTNSVTHSACDNYTWNGQTYTQSGDYTWTGQTINGCDSVVTLHLTLYPSITNELTASACDSYTWNGQTYTQSGDYTWTGQATSGCDSIVTLHLTIRNRVNREFTVASCVSYTWHEQTYTQSGDYTWTGQAANGCDSTVTLHLTINQPVTREITASACDSYLWNGHTYTQSGDYTWTGQTVSGCDSTVTLHLTINRSVSRELTMFACDSYTWNGQTYTVSGDYVWREQTANGCDSVVTLHLTINRSANREITMVVSGSYEWNGNVYTESGDYTWVGATVAGCDSTVVLHLTITTAVADSDPTLNIKIWPNPTNSVCHIVSSLEKATLYLFDAMGRCVLSQKIDNEETILDIRSFAPGVYMLHIVAEDKVLSKTKIIKQ